MNLSLLRDIESNFVAIAPIQLTLHGTHVHPLLEERTYSLFELREVLLGRATVNQLRDAVWRHTIRAARHSQEWMAGALGLAMPMLRSAVRHAGRGLDQASEADLQAEVVTAAIRQIRTANLDHAGQGYFLLCRVRRAALGERKRALTSALQVPVDEQKVDIEAEPGTARSCESVLQTAVRAGTLTSAESELIARTRLEKVSLVALSTETGVAYKTLAKRRQRAETRLAAALNPAPGQASTSSFHAASSPDSSEYGHRFSEVTQPKVSKMPWPLAS